MAGSYLCRPAGRQPDAYPVKAGLLLYVNELLPLASDLEDLLKEVKAKRTDIEVKEKDIRELAGDMPRPACQGRCDYRCSCW